jgi:drug/metabolite transporter (DMT)-like permease
VSIEKNQHRRAIVLMVCAATLWSIAGVVTRHLSPELQAHGRFEITFWRSFFAALFIAGLMVLVQREGLRPVVAAGRAGLVSGAMWAVMYSGFMLALTLTTTANTLLVLSVGPLLTALLAWLVLRTAIPGRTWLAIGVATVGLAWMFARGDGGLPTGSHLLGMSIALMVPLASAINLVTLKKARAQVDLVPAVFIGGTLSAVLMLVLMLATGGLPFKATALDVVLLATLGFFQLGLPCAMMIRATRHLSAPEVALLALIEVLLGPIWAWLGAGEVPAAGTLAGGALVLGALVANEIAGLKGRAAAAQDTAAAR